MNSSRPLAMVVPKRFLWRTLGLDIMFEGRSLAFPKYIFYVTPAWCTTTWTGNLLRLKPDISYVCMTFVAPAFAGKIRFNTIYDVKAYIEGIINIMQRRLAVRKI